MYHTNCWLVGATDVYEDRDDPIERFLQLGIWDMGFKANDSRPHVRRIIAKRDQMVPGDRIAIKRMNDGKNKKVIRILATGVITRAATQTKSEIGVEWRETHLDRRVPSRGCYATIHGPYPLHRTVKEWNWLRKVFGELVPD